MRRFWIFFEMLGLKQMSEISEASMALLQELSIIPQVVGYDNRVAELDAAKLIQWKSGEGYFISDKGREALKRAQPSDGGMDGEPVAWHCRSPGEPICTIQCSTCAAMEETGP